MWAKLQEPTSIIPLVVFRIAFGLLMLTGTIRFMLNGWIDTLYLAPNFHFTYYGFSWIRPLPGIGLYILFVILAILCILIALGCFYHLNMLLFFLLFTYTELIDKTYYLNHYYFISMLSFLLIFLPLNRKFALDILIWSNLKSDTVPRWTILAIRLQLGLVYFFAGVAKLKYDWLFRAMPLKIWLRANTDFPLIGFLFDNEWLAYLMSWSGAIYDLTIPFFLFWRKTRPWAYLAVLAFHLMTAKLFFIGMFPWVMIASTLIFFDEKDYQTALNFMGRFFSSLRKIKIITSSSLHLTFSHAYESLMLPFLMIFFLIQIGLPLRHWFYPGYVLWTEEGYRFAWNVMLAEKTAHTVFHVAVPETGQRWIVYPWQYLTLLQEKQMSFQPDMILEFAHYLEDYYREQGYEDIEVRVESYVSLNGQPSRLLIDPNVDLTTQENNLSHKKWILPFDQLPVGE